MPAGTSMKSIKGGKTEDAPDVRHITIRGVRYTLRELSTTEYKECLKAATNKDGLTPFGDLLEQMTFRCVSPSLAAGSKPISYPIYRTLEGLVNEMHFTDLPDEDETDDDDGDAEEESVEAPNS